MEDVAETTQQHIRSRTPCSTVVRRGYVKRGGEGGGEEKRTTSRRAEGLKTNGQQRLASRVEPTRPATLDRMSAPAGLQQGTPAPF
jgi:hypothetical protein